MTRRPVQQARRITDWPVKEEYVWSPSRATRVDVVELVVGTAVLMLCFAALVAVLFVLSGVAS